MSDMNPVIIGDATLYLGDCMDILPTLGKVDAVITDPPYSEITHAGHNAGARNGADKQERKILGYASMSLEQMKVFAKFYGKLCDGWIVWMTDAHLAIPIQKEMELNGRYAFAPLPFYQAGRSVRLAGDGPCSWTDWVIVSRTAAQHRWGTLPGGYIAGAGWNDKARMGGKPTALMEALVMDYSRIGDSVLDSHMGAGTTGVACMRTGRKFIGCEIDAAAFNIACQRIEQAVAQGQLFAPAPVKQVQETFL